MLELDKIATEQRNERSKHIDEVSTLELVTIINEEDKKVPEAIEKILPQIAEAIDCIVKHFRQGGRLFYGTTVFLCRIAEKESMRKG